MNTSGSIAGQSAVGVGLLLIGGGMAAGAFFIPSEAGYAGVGPDFLPWLVSVVLMICGGWVLWEARTGGYRHMEEPAGAVHGYWAGFAWVSAGLLANAALITTIGFILSCTLCFVLAVRGLRSADAPKGHATPGGTLGQIVKDLCIGFAIAAPVYWMFTKLLAINLPGLTTSGWI
jgi:putative tricarboxylic transport membrane protein